MESPNTRTLPPLSRVTSNQLEEALLHWEALDDSSLVMLASHPLSAKRLAGLRQAEAWLNAGGLRAVDLEALDIEEGAAPPCPSADELYDYGRGPGFKSLLAAREMSLRKHVETCVDCRGVLASLATPPPLPLELSSKIGELELRGPAPQEGLSPVPASFQKATAVPARPLRRPNTWLPFLAAAAIVGVALLPNFISAPSLGLGDLPQAPLLRGEEAETLLFPRGRVLAAEVSFGAAAARPIFELREVPGASRYRVEIFQHEGGAFEAGSLLHDLRATSPRLEGEMLIAGHYTWRAFAEVDGLERDLGALDVQVVEDERLAREVHSLNARTTPKISTIVSLIKRLDAAGLQSDAHLQAQRLPASPERNAYLNAPLR